MALAIFDLDHTLLDGDSDHAWGQYLVDRGLVDAEHHQQRNDFFYEQYQAGTLNIHEFLAFALQPLTRYPREHMEEERKRFLAERITPLISQKSRDLLQQHREQGDELLIITATNGFVTFPIAEMLGVEHIIAPIPEIMNDQYTGRIIGIPSFQGGKVTRLEQWLQEQHTDLVGSYFYSDSHNDLPLLRVVDHPVVVNPDPTLQRVAEEQQWPIISLRD
ncbi:MAG: HAD family hydrolase [Bacterioplanes sp.]|nr:HAD family hydrolase [Bacterioplanes sp.]